MTKSVAFILECKLATSEDMTDRADVGSTETATHVFRLPPENQQIRRCHPIYRHMDDKLDDVGTLSVNEVLPKKSNGSVDSEKVR